MAGAWPGPGTIEVEWTVRAHLPVRLPWLAPEELARMQRQPPALGRAWAAARCWVRARLAHRLDADPAALRLREGPSRRPTLAGTLQPAPGADFNVSHTDAVVVLAVSGGPVGVDVEVAPADPDLLALAEVVASPAELAQLRFLPADQLQEPSSGGGCARRPSSRRRAPGSSATLAPSMSARATSPTRPRPGL